MKLLKPLSKLFTLILIGAGVILFQATPASAETVNYISTFSSNYNVNAYTPQNNRQVILWQANTQDNDQKWVLNSPAGGMIRRAGSNFCLNAYNPQNYRKVILWECNVNDGDQKWEWGGTGNSTLIRRVGSSFCLNAYNPQNYREVILWQCDGSDQEQLWYIN